MATYAEQADRDKSKIFKTGASFAKVGILSASGNKNRVMGREMSAPKSRAAESAPPLFFGCPAAFNADTVREIVTGIPPPAAV